MNILLITPGSNVRHSGNRCTASQWADILRRQGHEVVVCFDIPGILPAKRFDLLLAMHGEKCAKVIQQYRAGNPEGKILLALTGTDIYPHPSEVTLSSMNEANGIIVLQEHAITIIPPEFRSRATVVIQSASPGLKSASTPRPDSFDVCVIGHLREVKNPMLTARASRLLPITSRIRIQQAGGILESKFETEVIREENENPRFHWLGELSASEVESLLSSCRLLVLTSHHEGGARVIGEAIAAGTPVVASRIDGVVGLLGESYPGFFPDGDAKSLAQILDRAETVPEFYNSLVEAAEELAPQFSLENEEAALARALKNAAFAPLSS